MKINEVEKLLKLSAKAIRFYEDSELLVVARDNSGYRDYSEENIQRLKEIKLYREMGISLANIKASLDSNENITTHIYQQIEIINQLEEKKDIYLKYVKDLEKNKEDIEGCLEALDFLNTEEYKEFNYRTLGGQIMQTLVLLIPIVYIVSVFQEITTLYYGLSLGIVALLTISWVHFIKEYEFTRNNILRDIRIMGKKIFLFIIVITIGISLFMVFQLLQKILFVPNNFMLLEFKYPYIYIPFFLFVEVIIVAGAIFNHKREMLDMRWMNSIYSFMKKHTKLFIITNICLLYVCLSSVCVITEKKIMNYSFYNPVGTEYGYNEITKVETGFRGNDLGISRNKGDFYYTITFNDGISLSIENPYANEKRYQDSYEEYMELDALIMQYDVIKVASDKNSEHVLLAPRYIDMMLTIINNK